MADLDLLALDTVAHGRLFIVEAVKTGRLLVQEGIVFVDEHQANLVRVDDRLDSVHGLGAVGGGVGGSRGGHFDIIYVQKAERRMKMEGMERDLVMEKSKQDVSYLR